METAVYDGGLDRSRFGVPNDAFGSAMVTHVGVFGLRLCSCVRFSRVPIIVTVAGKLARRFQALLSDPRGCA